MWSQEKVGVFEGQKGGITGVRAGSLMFLDNNNGLGAAFIRMKLNDIEDGKASKINLVIE